MSQIAQLRRWRMALAAALFAISALNLRQVLLANGYAESGYADFTAFYTAGKMIQRGQGRSLYDLKVQWQTQQEFASSVRNRVGPLPYIRPAFHGLLFLPLAHLPFRAAYRVWMAIKIVILIVLAFVLRRHLADGKIFTPWMAVLFSLATVPVSVDLLQGQDVILFLFICVLAFASFIRGAEFWSGICLGLGLFKFNLVLPVVIVLALRKKGRILQGFSLAAFILALVSYWLVGWEGLAQYPIYLWHLSQNAGRGVVVPPNMPNLRGLLSFLSFIHISAPVQNVLYVISTISGLIFVARLWNVKASRSNEFSVFGFSLALCVSLFLSPYCYGYDATMLILPTLLMIDYVFSGHHMSPWWKAGLFLSAGLMLFVPISRDLAGLWAIPLLSFVAVLAHRLKYAYEEPRIDAVVLR